MPHLAQLTKLHSNVCDPVIRLQDNIRQLEREKVKCEERWRDSMRLLRQWKDHLLIDVDHQQSIPVFIGQCLLPRCILTPEDAMYCAAFIRRLTLEDTPFFSFMRCAQMVSQNLTDFCLVTASAECCILCWLHPSFAIGGHAMLSWCTSEVSTHCQKCIFSCHFKSIAIHLLNTFIFMQSIQ